MALCSSFIHVHTSYDFNSNLWDFTDTDITTTGQLTTGIISENVALGIINFLDGDLTVPGHFGFSEAFGTMVSLNLDDGDALRYDRATDTYHFDIGTQSQLELTATLADFKDNNIVTTGSAGIGTAPQSSTRLTVYGDIALGAYQVILTPSAGYGKVWMYDTTTPSGLGGELRFTDDQGVTTVLAGPSGRDIGFTDLDTDMTDVMQTANAMALDSPAVTVTSDGAIISANIEKSGTGDVRVVFSTGVYTLDCTPIASVALTAGSDTSPQINYVYLLESNKTLTVSTSDFPNAEHMPIATVLCQSAATLQTDGAYKMHSWTDHAASSDNMGHFSHLNYWIRHQAATWQSGVALTPTITVNGGSEDNINIATSSGSVLQLHNHSYPAFDTAGSSDVYVVNKNGAAYTKVTDLNAADEDSAGNAIGNNRWTNLVVWGVVNEASGDCKLMVNLPSAFHTAESASIIDAETYSNYTIPADYTGVGFLIARLTFKYSSGDSGTWTLVENLDLRSSGAVGGSGAGATEFADNVFRILDNTDTSKEIAFEASGITTATTRTITMPDFDVDLGDTIIASIAFGDETTDMTAATDVATFHMPPWATVLTGVVVGVTTAPTGSTAIFDLNEAGTTVLSTKVTIDAGEKNSEDAVTPSVVSDSALAANALMTVDVDQIGSSVAGTGGKMYLIGHKA